LPASPTEDQLSQAELDFIPIYNALSSDERNFNYTLFLVQDASLGMRLYFSDVASRSNVEVAMSGNHSNELLTTSSLEEQKAILGKSKKIVESLKVCGVNEVPANGFKPQSFDQNEDTYKVLDDLGIEYNTGFQEGIIFAPGHENDVWPYKVDNHKFYVVPVSKATISGEKVPLDDRYIKNKGISASQWYDLLVSKLDEVSSKDEPMVVSLSTSVSGKGDYFDAFEKFLVYAKSNGAQFVKTIDLVNMARSGIHDPSAVSVSSAVTDNGECKTCHSDVSITNDTVTLVRT